MNRSDRLKEVETRLAQGQAMRSIARDLGVDEGTVRNDAKLLRLGLEAVLGVSKGLPAQKFLVAEQRRAAERSLLQRRAEEQLDQRHSKALALGVVDYLDSEPLFDSDRAMIRGMLVRKLWREQLGDHVAKPRQNILQTLRNCVGPLDDEMPVRIEQYVAGIAAAMVLLAPEKLVRDKAADHLGWALRVRQQERTYGKRARSRWFKR